MGHAFLSTTLHVELHMYTCTPSPVHSLSGEVHLRATAFNQQLCGFVFSKSEAFKSPAGPSNPFGSFDYLCLYHPEEHTAVMELLAAVEKGGRVIVSHTPILLVM